MPYIYSCEHKLSERIYKEKCFFNLDRNLTTGKRRIYGTKFKKKEVDLVPGQSRWGRFKILISGRSKTLKTAKNGHFSRSFLYRG